MRAAVRGLCQTFHSSAIALSAAFRSEAGRPNYVTPTSYLELIGAFGRLLAAGRARVLAQQQKYEVGGVGAGSAPTIPACSVCRRTPRLFPRLRARPYLVAGATSADQRRKCVLPSSALPPPSQNGLDKLLFTSEQVAVMRVELQVCV